MSRWILVALLPLLAASCREECGPYSRTRCVDVEEATFDVHFTFPHDRRDYIIGQVQGLKACRRMARSYATEMQVAQSGWSYVCCRVAGGSSCLEKHR